MEFGMSFLLGVLAGAAVVLVVVVIAAASRRAAAHTRKGVGASEMTRILGKDEVADAVRLSRENRQTVRGMTAAKSQRVRTEEAGGKTIVLERGSGNTKILDMTDDREDALNRNIQEVRDLLLTLASAVGATQDASGEAATAFRSAREAMANVDFSISAELSEAHGILIREIDRVVQSNAKLHSELDRANKGIVEQRRQIEELRVQSRIDALTRIPNRAAFDERLAEYLSLLERTNLVFTLMLLDLDFFKKINDTHGHVNGDRILRGIAEKISGAVRTNDFAARYGGEEFAVIFPATGQAEAMTVAERMRQDIAKTKFRLDDAMVKMTLSGGMAEAKKGMNAEQIIAAADGALYKAKDAGRNQILGVDGADSRNVERL